jgi:hypothetical protein
VLASGTGSAEDSKSDEPVREHALAGSAEASGTVSGEETGPVAASSPPGNGSKNGFGESEKPKEKPAGNPTDETPGGKTASVTAQFKLEAMNYLRLARQYVTDPEGSLGQTHRYGNVWPGAVFAVVSSIVMGLVAMLFAARIFHVITGVIGGFMGMLLLGSGRIRPGMLYMEIFFKGTLLFLAQWVILSLIIVGAAKLFKKSVTPVQALNGIGVTKLYVALGAVALLILHLISMPLGIAVLLGSLVLAYLAADRALRPLLDSRTILVLPLAVTLNFLAQMILFRVFF